MEIFFAAPFTGKIGSNGEIEGEYKEWLLKLFNGLREQGHTVISAHEREHWGKRLDEPKEAIVRDFYSIKKSDVLIAYIGSPPSYGVQMELGFAVAFKKPIILIRDKGVALPYLVPGLGQLTTVTEIIMEEMNKTAESLLFNLLASLRRLQEEVVT